MSVEISVVILCYRAGDRIYGFVNKVTRLLNRFVPSWEIVLVGNYIEGSDDDTPEIVRDIESKSKNIKAVTLPKKGMMGWDARTGLKEATGKYICLIDGDEQMPYRDIVRVYEEIKNKDLDFVKTYRAKRYDGFNRIAVSIIYNLFFNILFPGLGERDVNSKPKIFSRQAYDKMKLEADDWFLDCEIMLQARRHKFKIGRIPSKFYKCYYRRSFVKGETIFEFLKNLYHARMKEFSK